MPESPDDTSDISNSLRSFYQTNELHPKQKLRIAPLCHSIRLITLQSNPKTEKYFSPLFDPDESDKDIYYHPCLSYLSNKGPKNSMSDNNPLDSNPYKPKWRYLKMWAYNQ